MTSKYSHLNNIPNTKFDYANKMFEQNLPSRAFANTFTAGFLKSVQKILVQGIDKLQTIKRYKRF